MDAQALKDELTAMAKKLGFLRVGVARADHVGAAADHYDAYLAQGYHGEMTYMQESRDVRVDPRHERMLAGAQSVVVLATPYARADDGFVGATPGRVAKYARGRDYHNVLGRRTKKLAKWLRAQGYQTRSSVDSMPVYERAWAEKAGVGFIGKNACLIVPGIGSHVLLATLVTRAPLPVDEPMRERCGQCTLCLDGCPTRAFVAARSLDARKCISYLTIEQRGEIPMELRTQMGDWLFGCDACQDVCPFNRTAPVDASATEAFAAHERWEHTSAEDLLRMDDFMFRQWGEGSPVTRPGRAGLSRNAAVVLGNVGDKRHLPVLRAAVEFHDDAIVRESAAWALEQIVKRVDDQ